MKINPQSKFRRILILTLVVALLASCLTGCLGGKENDKDTDPSGDSTPPASQDAPSEPAPPTEPPAPSEDETEPQDEKTVMGTVIVDNLNVRSNPSMDSTVLNQLSKDTRVEILEQKEIDGTKWGRITEGWINLQYVTEDGETPEDDPTEPTEDSKDPDDTDTSGSNGTVTASELNIRKGPGTEYDSVGRYKKGDKVTILETRSGWGRTDKGWIKLKYVDMGDGKDNSDSTEPTKEPEDNKKKEIVSDGSTKTQGHVVITIGALNVRYGPGSSHDVADKVYNGQRCAYYQKSGNWVRITGGWIYTSGYAYFEGTTGENACSGTVTGDDLNIRQGPGTSFKSLGKLMKGDEVQILEQVTVGKTTWGFTGKGWISMDYVDIKK